MAGSTEDAFRFHASVEDVSPFRKPKAPALLKRGAGGFFAARAAFFHEVFRHGSPVSGKSRDCLRSGPGCDQPHCVATWLTKMVEILESSFGTQ